VEGDVMQGDKPHGTSLDLRKQAELRIQERFPNSEAVSNLTREEVEKLVHELQVHQIELEVQAEELRRSQTEVESLKDKYLDLYDFAPTGYVTVGANGLLIEANLTACRLLGRDRRSLINQPLSVSFVEMTRTFTICSVNNLLKHKSDKRVTSRLLNSDGRSSTLN
jgi:PAS domain-containing protein